MALAREVLAAEFEKGDWPTMPATVRECPFVHLSQIVQVALGAVAAALSCHAPIGQREGAGEGFDAAVRAIRAWKTGGLSDKTQERLEAVAHDLVNNKAIILGALAASTGATPKS